MPETSNLDNNLFIDTTRFSWQLTGDQLKLVNTKNVSQRLYFSLLFKFYEYQHCFFQSPADIPKRAVKIIRKQLDIPSSKLFCKSISDRTNERYRAEIRDYFQSRTIRQKDEEDIRSWLINTVLPQETLNIEPLKERVSQFLMQQKIECPSDDTLKQIIHSAKHQYQEKLFESIFLGLNDDTKTSLDELLLIEENGMSRLSVFKRWPGGLSLETILNEAKKLKFLKALTLPECLYNIRMKALQRHYRNISTKYPSAIKAMPEVHRYALLAIFALIKKQQVTDNLVDLLIRLTKKIITSGENKLKYVDTHGASEVGFAFFYMLDFDLLPRFKNIHAQSLYVVDKADLNKYSHLTPVVSRSINWDIIEAHKESRWLDRMALEDKRAITPLLHEHLNPYGIFLLNLDTRLAVNHPNFFEAA